MLDILWTICQVGLSLSLYSTIMAGAWKVTGELMLPKDERSYHVDREVYSWDKGHPLPILTGLFWPIALPMILPFWLYAIFKKGKFSALKLPKLPRFGKSTQDKVLDYAASPVLILSQLLAQRITREPHLLHNPRSSSSVWEWTTDDGRIRIRCSWLGSTSFKPAIDFVTISGGTVEVDEPIVLAALTKAHTFVKEKKAIDYETQRQLKALSAVETLLLEPIKNY